MGRHIVTVKEDRRCARCSGLIKKGSRAVTTFGEGGRIWRHTQSKTCQKFELGYIIAEHLIHDDDHFREIQAIFKED